MRTIYKISTALVVLFFMAACGSSTKEEKGAKTDKQAQLQGLKKQAEEINKKIATLEAELGTTDSTTAMRVKLVTAEPLKTSSFKHFIDLQGTVSTDNIYLVTPRNQGGQVKAVYVKEGDFVKKGQLLLKLEDGQILQQLEQAKIQLAYLQDLYNRRKNLWDQKIGTEVELITAKNNVANQQKQIDLLNEQLSYTNVYSEVSGIAETVTIRVGGFFAAPQAEGQPRISIVNPSNLKAVVNVPENYLPRVKKGTPVVIEIQGINKSFNSTITLVSQLIDPNSRSFTAEAKIPATANIKPNQIAVVKLQDYAVNNTIVVPMRTVQTDQNGKYVYVIGQEKGKAVALKKPIEVGEVYGEQIEVKAGLAAGDKLITQGYQGLYEGQLVTTVAK
jgi:membrane fusion protein, multidrug efflux system